jgi:diacylglycerol kinase
MKSSQKFSFKSRISSFRYAFNGFMTLLKDEHNSRLQLFAALLVIIAGIFFHLTSTEWILIIIVMGLVFIAELFNSAVESLADRISAEKNEYIRKAKDYCAAAVLLAAIIAAITGAFIFLPRIF